MTYHIYQSIDQYQLHTKRCTKIILTLLTLCLFTIQSSQAKTVTYLADEFDHGYHNWQLTMSTARSEGRGWSIVQHDQENSIRHNPSSSSKAVVWQLSQNIEVPHQKQNFMQVKSYFKKHQYQDFRILVQDQHDHLHVIHHQTQADLQPQSRIFDMQQFQTQKIRLIFQLRKPQNVKEHKIGLYIHSVQLYTESLTASLKIAAFNIQIFGVSKMDKPEVVQALLEIIPEFDIIFIQEIRDASGESLTELMQRLNAIYPNEFAVAVSDRLGRTRSKEQYAYLYRVNQVQLIQANVVADPYDLFERPPYITSFIHLESGKELTFVGAHLSPSTADQEIQALHDVVTQEFNDLQAHESLFVLGDFNADCRYLNQTERQNATLLQDTRLTSYIHDDLDTTTSSTDCAYDRLLSTMSKSTDSATTQDSITQAGVYHFDEIFKYDETLTREISDHYPVWAELQLQAL